jgi:hypothetical protein
MNLLPKIINCPVCNSINLIRVNGKIYENTYQSLNQWDIKKKFNCRKCKIELALFENKLSHDEKTLWLEYLDCDEKYYAELKKLTDNKYNKSNKIKNKKKQSDTLQDITKIQNEIRASKTALKIKMKIKSKGWLIRHVYQIPFLFT